MARGYIESYNGSLRDEYLHQAIWTCRGFVPVRCSCYAAFRSKATGLFQPNAECRRRGLQKPLMYPNRATSTSLRVCQFLRQIISALRDLKKLSTAALS